MSHKDVYEKFKLYLPQYAERTQDWFQNGRNSIRVRLQFISPTTSVVYRCDFVFTYIKENHWRFETLKSFLEQMKGDNTM